MVRDTSPGDTPLVPDGLSTEELLRIISDNGIIDKAHVADVLKVMKVQEVLSAHKNDVWIGANGYWYTHLPDENRTLIKKKNLKDLQDELVCRTLAMRDDPTAEDVFRKWNDRRADYNYIKPSTHGVNAELFDRYLGELGSKRMCDVTVFWLAEYLEGIVTSQNMTAKAFSNVKGLVKGTLKEARRMGLISFTADDVFSELDVPDRAFRNTRKDDSEEVFTPEETDLIINYILSDPTIRNLSILLMFISGIRVGELVALRWDDIHDGYFVVDQTETRRKNSDGKWEFYVRDSAKTEAGERLVAIPDRYTWIWEAIRSAVPIPSDYLFVDEEGNRLRANCIRSRMKKVCKRVSIPPRSPHKIRKTYCTMLFESAIDSVQITRQMGHTDISTSERFYYRDRSDIEDKIRAVSQIPEFNKIYNNKVQKQ